MSKEVDYKKQIAKAAKAKKRDLVARTKKKEEMLQEEEELKTNKSVYDKEERIRRKLLSDMVSKDLTEERFTRLYDKFYEDYKDDENMALFMILVRLSYDFDQPNFVNLVNRVLRSIKTNEAGALVKGRKGKEISNFYDTSATLELLKLIGESPKVIEKYNKKSFLDSSGQYKIVERFGSVDEAQRKEKRLLERMFNDAVRLTNLWRKKVEEEVGDKKGKIYKEEVYDEKELEEELKDERKRYDLLVELSEIVKDLNPSENEKNKSVFSLFLERVDDELPRRTDNNDLFKELLKISRLYDVRQFKEDLESILESYDDNHNSILSLLDRIRKIKILQDRYSAVRKVIRDDKGNVIEKTLEIKYGPLDDFIDRKKIEFLNLEKGLKYVEDKEVGGDVGDEKDIKEVKRKILDEGSDIEIADEYKDIKFYPLQKQDDKGKGRIVKKTEEKIKIDAVRHTLETSMKDFSLEQRERIRDLGVYYLRKYFDKDSSEKMEQEMYKETKDESLEYYLYRLGKIIILVDNDSLKHLAQLLNRRLENQYYDVYDLLHLSYKELLQDIYQNPLNKDFTELHNSIKIELNKFFSKFLQSLKFIDFDMPEISESYELFGPKIEDIHIIQSINSCNIEYKNKSFFEKYLKLKAEYDSIDVDNSKDKLQALKDLKDEEKNIRQYVKNIVYYNEDGKLYCFNFWELEENFEKKDYNNMYTGNRFSNEFIKDFEIVMKSKKKREKPLVILKEDIQKEIKENKFFKDIFDDINSKEIELKNKVSKDVACDYYKRFVFPDSNLEKILNKNKEDVIQLKKYCGVSLDVLPTFVELPPTVSYLSTGFPTVVDLPVIVKPKSPSSQSSSPKSHLSIPSIILGNSNIGEKKKEKVDISIPLFGDTGNKDVKPKSKKFITDDSDSDDSDDRGESDDSDNSDESDNSEKSIPVEEYEYSPIMASKESEVESKKDDESKVSKKAKISKLLKMLGPDLPTQ